MGRLANWLRFFAKTLVAFLFFGTILDLAFLILEGKSRSALSLCIISGSALFLGVMVARRKWVLGPHWP